MARGEPLIRQWNLLKAMQVNRYGLSAEELAERVECSKRQVLRDLKILQEVGFPIQFEQKDFGKRFWKLSSRFIESDKMIFSLTEMLSVYLSQQLLAPLGGTQFGEGLESLLEKIRATLPPQTLQHFYDLDKTIFVKNHVFNDYSEHDHKIRLLSTSIREHRITELTYQSLSRKSPYTTDYHPYGMILFDGDLYCIGFMAEYGEIRTLKINRILDLHLKKTQFPYPSDFSLTMYTQNTFGIFSADIPLQKIQIRMKGWAVADVREKQRHPSQTILQDDGNTLVVQFELADTTELKRWILGYGAHAAVLAPVAFRKEFEKEIQKMAQDYTP